ncbi:hypothetical protein MYX84_13350 [Acidobacteria bacterium AH-259-O06]|nr:hypothetical protein [Acidobacteria bacterium AH-259-O06]
MTPQCWPNRAATVRERQGRTASSVSFRSLTVAALFGFFLTSSPVTVNDPFSLSGQAGILVMAHGGRPEWNAAVEEAVAPLRTFCPVATAFGMAHPASLQRAVEQLQAQGVTRIAVVGLFVSSESFRPQTEYLLGLNSGPPPVFIQHPSDLRGDSAAEHVVHMVPGSSAPLPIRRQAAVVLNQEGLYDSKEIGKIIEERVLSLSISPESESVLILAHGEGDDAINQRWISKLQDLAAQVRELRPFRLVQVETLREDWQDKRAQAEEQIRDFVEEGNQNGGRVIVVPFRVYGFGPYADVLEGLKYVSDGRGLLPHPAVSEWIKHQAEDCFRRIGGNNPLATNATKSGSGP